MFTQLSCRQPRRDRRAGHPHAARHGHPLGRRVQRRRRRRPPCRRGRRRRADRAAAGAAELSRHRRGRRRRASAPAPKRSTRDTDSSPRTPISPPRCSGRGGVHRAAGRGDRTMGDKIAAKAAVSAFGVPVVPGIAEPGLSDADLIAAADEHRLPGAGEAVGRRRRQGDAPGRRPAPTSPAALAASRREAARGVRRRHPVPRAFRAAPRHIEVQVLADAHGTRRAPRRTRVQPAAPAPEGHRGGAVAAARRRPPAPGSAPPPAIPPAASTTSAPAPSSSSCPPTGPTSSSSWR